MNLYVLNIKDGHLKIISDANVMPRIMPLQKYPCLGGQVDPEALSRGHVSNLWPLPCQKPLNEMKFRIGSLLIKPNTVAKIKSSEVN